MVKRIFARIVNALFTWPMFVLTSVLFIAGILYGRANVVLLVAAIGCLVLFAAVAVSVISKSEVHEVPTCADPACEICGMVLREGADMELENGFDPVIDRMSPPDKKE